MAGIKNVKRFSIASRRATQWAPPWTGEWARQNRLRPSLPMGRRLWTFFFLAAWLLPGCEARSGAKDGTALLSSLLQSASSGTWSDCPGENLPPAGLYLADTVDSAPSQTGSGFGDTRRATDGICGAGLYAGSLDVFSMDDTGSGATMVLEWSGKRIQNGPGVDFVVFENPFEYAGGTGSFMDLIVVDVSNDGTNWCGFQADYTAPDETAYSDNPLYWSHFAGKTAVLYNQSTNPLNADAIFDPALAGGDGFDLSSLSATEEFGNGCTSAIQSDLLANGFIYIRLRAAHSLTNPDSSLPFPEDPIASGPDIDGLIARYAAGR